MASHSYHHLAFFLSLGSVPLACADGGDDDSETAGESNSGTVGATTTGAATTEGASTSTATGTGTSGATASTTAAETTGMTSTTADPDELCAEFGAAFAGCYGRYGPEIPADYFACNCEHQLGFAAAMSPECGAAYEVMLTCWAVYTAEDCDYGPCEPEQLAAEAACLTAVPSEVCEAYAATYGACYGFSPEELEDAAQECQMFIADGIYGYGEACGAAYSDLYACLSALSCRELEAEDGCADAWAALTASCAAFCADGL